MATCITSASNKTKTGVLRMAFDDGPRTNDAQKFEYVQDPTVDSVESGVAGQVILMKIVNLLVVPWDSCIVCA